MNKKYYLTLLILFFGSILIISCQPENNSDLNIEYVEADSLSKSLVINSDEPDDLYVSKFALSSEGTIYFTDDYRGKLAKVDRQNDQIKYAGGFGEGPGEFKEGTYINLILYQDNIHAVDILSFIAHIYSKDLNYESSIHLDHMQFDAIQSGNNKLIHNHSTEPQTILKLYKGDERVDIEFPIVHDPYVSAMNLFHIGFLDDFNFYVAYWFRNLIKVINLDGEVVQTMNVPEWPEESEMKTVQMPDEMMIKSVTATDHGEILVLGSGYTENKHQDIHLFDSEGKYKHTFVLPQPTSMIKYHDGKIYTTSKDRTNIVAYAYPEKIISR